MPEAPTIVAPAPPSRPAAPGAPSAVPASAGEIHVTPRGTTAVPAAVSNEPKVGAAKQKLRDSLVAKSNANPRTAMSPAKPAAPAAAPAAAPKPGEAAPAAAAPAAQPGAAPAAAPEGGESTAVDPATGKKPSPWKLVDQYKERLTKAEAELLELRKGAMPEADRKAVEERLARAEARAKELEEKMVFTDYSQTEEFKQKYVAPYDKAWRVAMAEMKGIMVSDDQGGERPVTPEDLLTIVNSPLAQARQLADKHFGSYANDVMAHRNEIRGLYDKQQEAIEEVKKNGLTKKQQETEAQQRAAQELNKTISTVWKQENDAVLSDQKHGNLFKPRENDEEWNSSLKKGYELVDTGWSVNPGDPKLTPEQRTEIIRKHAAIRNRAAAFGPLRVEVNRLQAQVKSLTDELAQYKGSEPPSGSERTVGAAAPATAPGGAKARLMDELRKKAR